MGLAGYAHKKALGRFPGYGRDLHALAMGAEELSPGHILRTFGLGDLFSSYLVDKVHIRPEDLFAQRGGLTDVGAHLDRLIGRQVDVRAAKSGLTFVRPAGSGSAYLDLEGTKGVSVRFTQFLKQPRGYSRPPRLAGSSFRYGKPLAPDVAGAGYGSNWFERTWTKYKEIRRAQWPKNPTQTIQAVNRFTQGELAVQPYLARVSSEPLGGFFGRANRFVFEKLERTNSLLAQIGVGLEHGSYNKIAHVPFFGGADRGILNAILTKRVLPVVAGVAALKYGDYLLGHRPSNAIVGLYPKTRVAHAELTDKLPFARSITDFYDRVVPGPQYAPLALPVGGAFLGGLYHYGKVLRGHFGGNPVARSAASRLFADASKNDQTILKYLNRASPIAKGLAIGAALMLPFVPGMLGSRKHPDELRRIFSGEQPVPIRAGRWWELGTSPWQGNRIKEWRPHWFSLFKARAEEKSLYGDEKSYWKHHPLLHPIRYLRDPYWMEREHYEDRPYGITAPAFSNVPLIGPLLAATIGKVVKPPRYMHRDQWDQKDYSLYSTRLEPKDGKGLPPPAPQQEFGLLDAARKEGTIFSEYIGLPGFIARSIYNKIYPGNKGKQVFLESSRNIDSTSRRYYEKELGAVMGPNAEGEAFGYSEPFRRFVQREQGLAQANEIPNRMPSWLPGDDYFINLRVGDPYAKLSNGYARLPGAGYEALHPELEGLNPEEYPDLERFKILADVAPYSKEYATYRGRIGAIAKRDTGIAIEYQRVLDQVRQTKDSVINTTERRFTEDTEEVEGTIESATSYGVRLREYPGRTFSFSSVGTSAADLSAVSLREQNNLTKSQQARVVEGKQEELNQLLSDRLAEGTRVKLTVPQGATAHNEEIRAVIESGGKNINREILDQNLGQFRKDQGGAETRAMFGFLGRAFGSAAEHLAFTGDESPANPLRLVPQPFNSKLWQERTPFAQYREQEIQGARMRRWERPLHDFVMPYVRGLVRRVTGETIIPGDVEKRRELNTLTDMLSYIRGMQAAGASPGQGGRYTNQASRTTVGSNLFSSPTFVASTLPDREAHYFRRFLDESDEKRRQEILELVPKETAEALTAQWVVRDARIARADGNEVPNLGEEGRLYTEAGLKEYEEADTKLGYGDFQRSQEIAEFFARSGYSLPEPDAEIWNDVVDYDDVKLKIIQQEGYEAHDFNIFDDRAALLWRKPWVDGAVRELTTGGTQSSEELRRRVEDIILTAHDKNPRVVLNANASTTGRTNVEVNVDLDESAELEKDMRRNPEEYVEQ